MKIRLLLVMLCMALGLPVHSQEHYATPRREIRHKIKQLPVSSEQPEDNGQWAMANPSYPARISGEYVMSNFPTIGEAKGVVILAAFADVPFSISGDSIHRLLSQRYNADGYTEEIEFKEYSVVYGRELPLQASIPGSARDYFRTQSMGAFVPSFDVVGPVTLDNPRAYYGANKDGNDANTGAMIREACQKAYLQGLTTFTDYDNDADGVVDFVYVVYAGSDEAQTGIEECVWAKSSTVSLTLGDMRIRRYACSSELVIDLPVVAGIGTFVHEFGHILGLPDFYNTRAEDFTMDMWSVMDYGMYNAEGFVPCAYTAFERYSLGWLPMHTLDAPTTISLGTTEEEGRGYRIFTSQPDSASLITGADTASYYLVETIRQEGWNRYAPAEGLLISEVTYLKSAWQNNTVNVDACHRHCIVPANNSYSYKTANKHLFGTANHEFSLTSVPASITQFGAAMDKPLTDIRYDAATGKTTLHFRGGTGVDDLIIRNQETGPVYDLQGRKVDSTTRGIYIQEGKKCLMRF
ncbi:MAG: M6 family metalloprotease domain-containing protein [Bacteroidaceae bacterium]|nr:M6 family metalloprotease domain-containing protein [Bacteroidaceae bacterium]